MQVKDRFSGSCALLGIIYSRKFCLFGSIYLAMYFWLNLKWLIFYQVVFR